MAVVKPPLRNGYRMDLLMSVYNKAMAWARRTGATSENVINKALGLLMSVDDCSIKFHGYQTWIQKCSCLGTRYKKVCYHRVARWMQRSYFRQVRTGEFIYPFN